LSTRPHLSIATKLPLGLATLLLVIMGAMTLLVYREVRSASIDSAFARLEGVSQLLSDLLGAQQRQRVALITRIAERPEVRAYLLSGDAAAGAALSTLLQPPASGAAAVSTEIWDGVGARLLRAGAELPAMEPARAQALMATLRDGPPAALGSYELAEDGGVRFSVIARVLEGSALRGYVVERRQVTGSPQEVRQLTELIGSEARLVLGNTAGDVWTDLAAQVDAPPTTAFGHDGVTRYTRANGEVVLARVLAIPSTPWSLAIEFPEAPVLAQARRVLSRAAFLSLLLVALGATAGWYLSRRISMPLREVTEAAEGIAAGRRAAPVREGRKDEVGRLAASFNTMMARIEDARHTLEALVKRYRVLFDDNPLPMWLYDRENLAFIDVNGAAIEHYGYERAEFLERTLVDLRLPGDPAPGPEDNGRARITRHRRSDGSVIDVEVTRRHMDLGERPVVLALANDVTTRLAAERGMRESRAQLERLNAELEGRVAERTAALEAANRELEAFSYSVSHDLRAPLRAVDGFAAVLEEDYAAELPGEAQRYLTLVRHSAQQMGQLIDDLLTFSRIGRQSISPTRVDMNELARGVVDETRRQQQERAIEVVIDSLPPAVGERSLLKQVLANYVQNAVKFTRNREAARIQIGHHFANGETAYFVRDNGVGFDMRYVDKLFGVFQRLHSADEFEGTGVGLAIVQRIIQRHGGRVWAEGAVNDGATFYFTLPREPQSVADAQSRDA
jgi:hypothetical protein